MDAKGAMLLLLRLAVEAIQERANDCQRLGRMGEGGRLDVLLSEDDLTVLAHADIRMERAVRAVEAAFEATLA